MKFLVPNYSCLQNTWLGSYHAQIPVLSVLNWICWNPPPPKKKFLGTPLRLRRAAVFQENPQDMYILLQYLVRLFVPFAVACCGHCTAITDLYINITLAFFKGSWEEINNGKCIGFCSNSFRNCFLLQQKQIKQQLKLVPLRHNLSLRKQNHLWM